MIACIASLPRSGSHFLASGILRHPGVAESWSEVLTAHGRSVGSSVDITDGADAVKEAVAERSSEEAVYTWMAKPEEIREYGLYGWEGMTSNPVVYLERRNKLEQAVSARKAEKAGVWRVGYHSESERDVKVDVSVSLGDIRRLEVRDMQLRLAILRSCDTVIHVTYEDLRRSFAEEVRGVWDALGLDPSAGDPAPGTERQRTRPLRDAVTNYDELKEECHGTRYERFFPE
jgi:hypothetical protein